MSLLPGPRALCPCLSAPTVSRYPESILTVSPASSPGGSPWGGASPGGGDSPPFSPAGREPWGGRSAISAPAPWAASLPTLLLLWGLPDAWPLPHCGACPRANAGGHSVLDAVQAGAFTAGPLGQEAPEERDEAAAAAVLPQRAVLGARS